MFEWLVIAANVMSVFKSSPLIISCIDAILLQNNLRFLMEELSFRLQGFFFVSTWNLCEYLVSQKAFRSIPV